MSVTRAALIPNVNNTTELSTPNIPGALFYNTEYDRVSYKNNSGIVERLVNTDDLSVVDDSSSNATTYLAWVTGPGLNQFHISTGGSLGGLEWNPGLGVMSIGSPDLLPHIGTNMVLYNRAFGQLSLSFTGVDYPAFYGDHEGISMGLGLNGNGNKEIWIVDSAYSDAGNTEIAMRFGIVNTSNICFIDSISTDRSTNLPIKFGNETASTILAGSTFNLDTSSISPNTLLGTDGSNNLMSITYAPILQQLWVNAASGNDSNNGDIYSAFASYEAARLAAVALASPTNEYLIHIIGDQSITGNFTVSPYITVDGHNSGTIIVTGDIVIDDSLLTLSNQTQIIQNCSFNINSIDIEYDTGVNNFVVFLNCDFPNITNSCTVSSNTANTTANGVVIIGKPSTFLPPSFEIHDTAVEFINLTMITTLSISSSGTSPTSLSLLNVQGVNTISAASSFGGSIDIELSNSQPQNLTLNDASTSVFTDVLSLNSKNLTLSGGATSSQITYNTDCSAQNVSTLLYVPTNYTPSSPNAKVRSDSILSHLNGINSALGTIPPAWTEVTGTSQAMLSNNGYVTNNAGLVTLTLPATCAFGTIMYVDGKGSGGWKIAQNSGQTIYYQGSSTTTGATGHLDSTNARACVALRCITANTEWVVETTTGAITLV